MKKFLIICTIIVLICALTFTSYALPSPTPENYYSIQVLTKGEGQAESSVISVIKDNDEVVIFSATETTEKFVFWNITGDYDIVSGDYEELEFAIRPHSDIVAVATFESGVSEHAIPVNPNTNPISPKTGDDRANLFILLTALVIGSAVLIFMNWKNRPKH